MNRLNLYFAFTDQVYLITCILKGTDFCTKFGVTFHSHFEALWNILQFSPQKHTTEFKGGREAFGMQNMTMQEEVSI